MLNFLTTSITRDFDAPDGYRYRTITTLDFHQGWYTRLMRTKLHDNGFPMWGHAVVTESLTELGCWSPNCAARPIRKFETVDIAAEWLEEYLEGEAHAKVAS
jgi:hypothetical protein